MIPAEYTRPNNEHVLHEQFSCRVVGCDECRITDAEFTKYKEPWKVTNP